MKPANYAPVYAGLYPDLAEIARKHGYAMAIHGSLASDMDLICIPWVGGAAEPQAVVNEILETYAIRRADGNPKIREHGRMVYTLVIAAPRAFVDLSFMPMGRPAPSASREVTDSELAQRLNNAASIIEQWDAWEIGAANKPTVRLTVSASKLLREAAAALTLSERGM